MAKTKKILLIEHIINELKKYKKSEEIRRDYHQQELQKYQKRIKDLNEQIEYLETTFQPVCEIVDKLLKVSNQISLKECFAQIADKFDIHYDTIPFKDIHENYQI